MKQKNLLKNLFLPILFLAVCTNLNAATGNMTIGGTSVPDLSINATGTGWTWNATTETLDLTSVYTGKSIEINCQSTDVINLVYDGNITVSNATADGIYCNGSLTIGGSNGILTFAYTGEDYMYSGLTTMQSLTINSGDINIESSSSHPDFGASAVYAVGGFNITGTANVTSTATGDNAHGLYTEAGNSEISTTGTVTVNATGDKYALHIENSYFLTISNGTINLSNEDTPENMIWSNRVHGFFDMTGGTVTYNGGTPPTLSSLSPTSGTHNTEVILSGNSLTGVTNVFVNRKTTKSFTVNSDSQLTFTTPAGEAGTANVVVQTSGGAACMANSYTYTNTSYRVSIVSGGNIVGAPCGFVDTEAGIITKPADPAPITSGAYTYAFTGGWYTNWNCTTEWNFSTETINSDRTIYAKYETLPTMTPADGAVDVALDANVMATYFSVPTVNDLSGITLSPNPGNVNASLEGNTITISHDDFEYGTTYTVTIPAGATNRNTIDVVWSFTTEAALVLSSDATLSALTVSEGTLTPTFSASVTDYTVTVANSISSITINATANDGNATLSGNTGTQNLNIGENEFNILVTAEDQTTTETYKIIVTRGGMVGIDDINSDNGIQIYPNPTTDKIIIDNAGVEIGEVSIFNINGKKLSTLNSQLSTLEINLADYANGIYLIQINGKTTRIIKQ